MKNLKNIFALFILLVASVSMYSCDSTVTIDDPKADTIEDSSAKTGDEGNETVERDG